MSSIPQDLIRGSVHESNNFGSVAVLSYRSKTEVQVVFLETLHVDIFRAQAIRAGKIKDHSHSVLPGKVYQSKNFGSIEVIESSSSRQIRVRFLNTGHIDIFRADHIKNGNIKDNSLLITEGDIYTSNNYGLVEVKKVHNHSKIEIIFLETNTLSQARGDHIKTGSVRDPSLEAIHARRTSSTNKAQSVIKCGDILSSNSNGDFEILEISRHQVKIRFTQSGYETSCYKSQIKKGEVRDHSIDHTPDDMAVGALHVTNSGDIVKVLRYGGADDVDIEFKSTGYIYKSTRAKQVRDGAVQDRSLLMQVGEIYDSNRCGKIKVIQYKNSSNVIVEFLNTGEIVLSQASRIRIGEVVDPTVDHTPRDMINGTSFFHSELGEYVVEGYVNSDNVTIRFIVTDGISIQTSTQVRSKKVSDPMRPSAYGFNMSKPANLYLVHWSGLGRNYLKFGITNRVVMERVAEQARRSDLDWELVNVYHYNSGVDAFNLEQKIKNTFDCGICPKELLPDGFSETLDFEALNDVIKLIGR
jgi:hypothetical protein